MATRATKRLRKFVYFYGYGKKHTEGDASFKALLGGKGANLAEMANANLPVPPGFTISTEACAYYSKNNRRFPPGMEEQLRAQLKKLEVLMGKKAGRSPSGLRAFRCSRIYARHDGYCVEPGPDRSIGARVHRADG